MLAVVLQCKTRAEYRDLAGFALNGEHGAARIAAMKGCIGIEIEAASLGSVVQFYGPHYGVGVIADEKPPMRILVGLRVSCDRSGCDACGENQPRQA